MDIIIKENYEQMSTYTADYVAAQIREKPDLVLGLATGSTPIGTYRKLVRMHREEGLDFSRVRTFNLDEYLGINMDLSKPPHEDQSYARFMHEELFRHVNIEPQNIHVMDGRAANPQETCRLYEEAIADLGGIDLQILGLGRDGHWGFNEPGSSLGSRTRIVALTAETLDDNYVSFYQQAGVEREDMPHFALTMGVATILDARKIIMIVNGFKKADIVARALEGPVTSQVTASAIQLHSGVIRVVLDDAAASRLTNANHYRHVESLKELYGF